MSLAQAWSKKLACCCQAGFWVRATRGEPSETGRPARKRAVSFTEAGTFRTFGGGIETLVGGAETADWTGTPGATCAPGVCATGGFTGIARRTSCASVATTTHQKASVRLTNCFGKDFTIFGEPRWVAS